MRLNPVFITQLTKQFGSEASSIIESLDREPTISVRRNPHKNCGWEPRKNEAPDPDTRMNVNSPAERNVAPDSVAGIAVKESESSDIITKITAEKIPLSDSVAGAALGGPVLWSMYGRYLTRRPSFTFDPSFHAGKYYVQEASSMFVEHIFRSVTSGMGRIAEAVVHDGGRTPNVVDLEGVRILDLCAAPGGKATLYSTLAGAGATVVANEVIRGRAGILADNIRKWGLGNVVVTSNDPSHFTQLGRWFDIVAVDAPCSGEGMFRKNPEARLEWSADNVKISVARQRRILAHAWETLRPGGVLIYSTCTFNREENEENITWLAENYDCHDAGIEVPSQWNIVVTEAGGVQCFRFMPHRVMGEGFFACAVRKGETAGRPVHPRQRREVFTDPPRNCLPELQRWVLRPELMRFATIGDNFYGYHGAAFQDIKTVSENLNAIHSGVCMGQLFGGRLKPDHSLAMFHELNIEAAGRAELSPDQAIKYLQKGTLPDLAPFAEGFNAVTCQGATLGWAKRIGHRINNLYPNGLAIMGRK